jgi:hypothetical protein
MPVLDIIKMDALTTLILYHVGASNLIEFLSIVLGLKSLFPHLAMLVLHATQFKYFEATPARLLISKTSTVTYLALLRFGSNEYNNNPFLDQIADQYAGCSTLAILERRRLIASSPLPSGMSWSPSPPHCPRTQQLPRRHHAIVSYQREPGPENRR